MDGVNVLSAEYAAESNDADDGLATCNGTYGTQGMIGEPSKNWPCMLDFVCAGKKQSFTHSRGMCQRGSQRWASGLDNTGVFGDTNQPILNSLGNPITPRDWRCILDHYYNANSNSVTVDPNYTGPGSINVGTAGTQNRTAFLQGAPTYGNVAYEAYTSKGPASIRVASAADGSGDHLLVSSGLYPAWEPGGGRLIYANPTNTNWGISMINADGSGQKQITSNSGVDQYGNPTVDFAPAWSPLGDKIAFCSTRSGSMAIWVVNPDATGLAMGPHGVFIDVMAGPVYEDGGCYLRWSPDGTKIAFTGDTAYAPYRNVGTTWEMYSVKADGTAAATQLTSCQINNLAEGYESFCGTPSWSPDGTRIAFSDGDTPFGDNIGGGGIYTRNPDASTIAPVFQSETTLTCFPNGPPTAVRLFLHRINPATGAFGQFPRPINPSPAE